MGEGFGIYIHAPWCRTRCPYCAFNVYPDREASWERWAEGVAADWASQRERFVGVAGASAHSVYFGGGTPSLAPPELIRQILDVLPCQENAEISLEANPGDLSEARIDAWRALGINRLSLGVQTFNPAFAHLLNRGHTAPQSRALADRVAEAGLRSWSLDVIFGLPGQSLDDLRLDLDQMLARSPPHASLYGLTFEEGTPFGRAAASGRLVGADPDLWRLMYDHVTEALEAAGLERYEVSNFAVPGHRSAHNEAVWRGGYYAGLGPGAHGYEPSGHRTVNTASPEAWMSAPLESRQLPTPAEAATDFVLSTLRHRDGLPLDALRARTGHRVRLERLAPLLHPGRGCEPLLAREYDALRLTRAGFPIADGLVERVVDALDAG